MTVERPPCQCHACVVAGVNTLPQRLDPRTYEWLHGLDLRRWWEARRAFVEQAARLGIKVGFLGGDR